MRKIAVENLHPGMILERPVYARGGRILLDKGIKLTDSYINRLSEFSVAYAYIWDERTAGLEINDVVDDETRLRAAEIVENTVNNIRFGTGLNGSEIKETVQDILEQILANRDTVAHLSEIRIAGEELFHHSVTVTIYALLTGLSAGYGDRELMELGTGALLHDVGRSCLPAQILDAKRPLSGSASEELKNHTVYGFEILRREAEFSLLAAHVAYQHHERFDGSGYPRRLKGNEIHEYARITAIANTYDLLVSGLEEKQFLPYQAIEYIVAQAGRAFDPRFAQLFSTNIAVYPLGSMVRLNTGQKGFVVKIPKNYPTRPVVRVVEDADGNKYTGNGPEIELLTELTVFIEDVLDD